MSVHSTRHDVVLRRLPETGEIGNDPDRALHAGSAGWDPNVPFAPLDPIVDVSRLRQLLLFPVGALKRHRRVAALVLAGVLVATAAIVAVLPRSYFVQSRLLARRNLVMPALGNPRRAVPLGEADAPTRMAAEAVMSRENLERVISQAKLMENFEEVLSPLGRLRYRVRELISGPRSDTERLNGMVGMLEQYMWVVANEGNEGQVTIGVSWRDPNAAVRIVQAAQENFVQRRYETEVALIEESIGILERYVGDARQTIQESMTASRPASLDGGAPRLPAALQPRTNQKRAEEIVSLQGALRAKEGAVAQLETEYRDRIARRRAELNDLQSRLGTAHPQVLAAQRAVQAAESDSTVLQESRSDAAALLAQLTNLGGSRTLSPYAEGTAPATREYVERWLSNRSDSLESPDVTYARSRLKIAIANYEDLVDRLESARIELETSKAAFKYRYTVIAPAQLPEKPATPNVPRLLIVGVLLAVMLSVFAVTALDVLRGRIVEPWQLHRQLGLPVLGEVRKA